MEDFLLLQRLEEWREQQMSHRCQIGESSVVCFEERNELWVKEYADGRMPEGRTYQVKFCPECGLHLPKCSFAKRFFGALSIPDSAPDDRITQFSQQLSNAISEMNHNIAIIKCHMSAQHTQNECFMEMHNELKKRITNLEKHFASSKQGEKGE